MFWLMLHLRCGRHILEFFGNYQLILRLLLLDRLILGVFVLDSDRRPVDAFRTELETDVHADFWLRSIV